MALDALERRGRAIDQHALGRLADPQRGRVAQPLARKLLDLRAPSPASSRDIDVDGGNRPTDDADAAARPARPGLELDLGGGPRRMAVPLRIVCPVAARIAAGLLGAGRDRQDGIAIGTRRSP